MKINHKQEPKQGEIKKSKGFAFFPKCISPGKSVWFERYQIEIIYQDWRNGSNGWQVYDRESGSIYNKWQGRWHKADRDDFGCKYQRSYKDIPIVENPILQRKPAMPKKRIPKSGLGDIKRITIGSYGPRPIEKDTDVSPKKHGRYAFVEESLK